MRVLGIRPDRVLSSSLTRAVQTAEIVARELRISAECIESTPHLAPGGDHFALLREQLGSSEPDASILIVGHEPGLSELLSLLITGSVTGIDIPLKKASLCRVDCGGPPPGERGTLRCLLTPSQLRALTKSR
jgi:phosphohistidine phosphatase